MVLAKFLDSEVHSAKYATVNTKLQLVMVEDNYQRLTTIFFAGVKYSLSMHCTCSCGSGFPQHGHFPN